MGSPAATIVSDGPWAEWMRSREWEHADTAIPMLPAAAQEIVDLALDPDVSVAQIVSIVSKDPVLATRVIQLANTAAMSSSKQVSSIQEAVVRIGTGLVRTVMTSTCLNALKADPHMYGSRGRECVDHSLGTAYLAWLVAGTGVEAPAEAFLYGLLHDVGKLLILKLSRQALRYGILPPDEDELSAVMAEHHAHAGGYLLRQWGLPGKLHDPVVWHHEPHRAEAQPVAAAVAYAANRLAHRYGFACRADDFDPQGDPVFEQLGLDAASLARIDLQAPALFDLARRL